MRSDTVKTRTPRMRAAMVDAAVGDDVYLEDPTVAALERRVPDDFGHESALLMPTGTMANQVHVDVCLYACGCVCVSVRITYIPEGHSWQYERRKSIFY